MTSASVEKNFATIAILLTALKAKGLVSNPSTMSEVDPAIKYYPELKTDGANPVWQATCDAGGKADITIKSLLDKTGINYKREERTLLIKLADYDIDCSQKDFGQKLARVVSGIVQSDYAMKLPSYEERMKLKSDMAKYLKVLGVDKSRGGLR